MVRYDSDSRETMQSERRRGKERKRRETSATREKSRSKRSKSKTGSSSKTSVSTRDDLRQSESRRKKRSSSKTSVSTRDGHRRSVSPRKRSSSSKKSVSTRDGHRRSESPRKKNRGNSLDKDHGRSRKKEEGRSRKKERGRSRTRRAPSRDRRDDDMVHSRPIVTDNRVRASSYDSFNTDIWELQPYGEDMGFCAPELLCCGCVDDDFSVNDQSQHRSRALTRASTFNTGLSGEFPRPKTPTDPRRWFNNMDDSPPAIVEADSTSEASDLSIDFSTQVSVVMQDTLFLWKDPTPARTKSSKSVRRDGNGSSVMWNPPRCASNSLLFEGQGPNSQGLYRSIEAANGGNTSFKGPSKAACRNVLEQLHKKQKTESPYNSIPMPTVSPTIIFPPNEVDQHLLGKRNRSSSDEEPMSPPSYPTLALPAPYSIGPTSIEEARASDTPWAIKNLENEPILKATSTPVHPPATETIILPVGEHQAKEIPPKDETESASDDKAANVLEKLAQAGIIMDRDKAPVSSTHKTGSRKKLSRSIKSFLDGRAEHNSSTGPLADPTLAMLDQELDFLRSMLSTPSNVEMSQPDPTKKKNDDYDEIEISRSVVLKEEESDTMTSNLDCTKNDPSPNKMTVRDSKESPSESKAAETKEEESAASSANPAKPPADAGTSNKRKPTPEKPSCLSTMSLVPEVALKTFSDDFGSLIDGQSVQTESSSTTMRKEKLATLLSQLSFNAREDTSVKTKSAHVPRANKKTTAREVRKEAALPPEARSEGIAEKQKSRPPFAPGPVSRDNTRNEKTGTQQNTPTTTISKEQNIDTVPNDANVRSTDTSKKSPSDDSRPEEVVHATPTPCKAASTTVPDRQQGTITTLEQRSEERFSASEIKHSSPMVQSPVSLDSPQPISNEQASGDTGNEKPSGHTSPTSVTASPNQKEAKSTDSVLSTPTPSVAVIGVVTKPRTRAVQSSKDMAMARLVEDILKVLVRGNKPDFDAARALIEKSKASQSDKSNPAEKDESETSVTDKAAKADPINVLIKDIELCTEYEKAQSGKLSSTGKFLNQGSAAIQRIMSEQNTAAKSRRPAPCPEGGGMGRMGMPARKRA